MPFRDTHFSASIVDGINHLERLLRKQLIAAVGREITAQDFVEYMDFHNSRRYGSAFQPKTFCYAIRRPDHYPEGIVSIGETILIGFLLLALTFL